MRKQIRRITLGVVALFALLFVNLNVIAVLQAEELRTDQRNARGLLAEYETPRGAMIAGQGGASVEIAGSTSTGGRLDYLREYPEGPTYAHVTGFHSFVYGRSELESSFNDFLIGSAPEAFARNIADLLAGRQRAGDTLQLTIDPRVQRAAVDALDGRVGAIVAVAPATGEILALASAPTYDPNPLASHDGSEVREAWSALSDRDVDPRLNRALRETYPPGSTFKLVSGAAALESGVRPDTVYPDPPALELPLTEATIRNFGSGVCADGSSITLSRAMAVSCNTTFGQIGLDLGTDRLVRQAERFGLNAEWDLQMDRIAESAIPDDLDEPSTAQSAIGQRDVRTTPLQVAMMSAAIANDGELVEPRIVRHVEDVSGRVLTRFDPEPLRFAGSAQAVSAGTAAALRDMMVEAVEDGTGTGAAIGGVRVGGKTGTAQRGEGEPPTVWFTGFAPAELPEVAVAVVNTDTGAGDTGGSVAAPKARAVIEAALAGNEQD